MSKYSLGWKDYQKRKHRSETQLAIIVSLVALYGVMLFSALAMAN